MLEWKTNYYLLYGRCFTFQMLDWIKKLKIAHINIETKLDAYVFIHNPGKHLLFDFNLCHGKVRLRTRFGFNCIKHLPHFPSVL